MTPGLPGTLKFTVSTSEPGWVGRTPPRQLSGLVHRGPPGGAAGKTGGDGRSRLIP